MSELIAGIIELFATIAFGIDELIFRRKRRKFEKENNLPKMRKMSPFQRYLILLVLFFIISILVKIIVFPTKGNNNKNSKRIEKIKELLEKEKKVFGAYPEKLQSIKRGDPLRKNLLIDDWGTTFRYSVIEDSYLLISAGKDKKFETEDDIQFN